MYYKKLLFFYWLLRMARDAFALIPITALLALLAWFFTNVVSDLQLTYLTVWRWSYIISFGIVFIYSFRKILFRWKVDTFLARQWNTTPEVIFDADINLKLFGKATFEQSQKKFNEQEFKNQYQMKKNIHQLQRALR